MPPSEPESNASTRDFAGPSRSDNALSVPDETSAGTPRTLPDSGLSDTPFARSFGAYDLLHLAGEGGMGVVYQARRKTTGEVVALKTMKAHAAVATELVQRFYREIRTVDAVRHPNIVPVLEVGEENGRLYYTMPFAPMNLSRQKHLFREPPAAVSLVIKVARALHHAHAQGVIHRDLKPANILLTAEGEPLIADFGLARWLDASQALTQSFDRMGTPAYMAPEQASGPSQELGGSADIWSLGVILYELLTGQRPFDAANQDALFYQIRNSNPPSPRSYRPEIDSSLEAIVLMCLCKDRVGRYTTAAGLADDLERWQQNRPVRAQIKPPSSIPQRFVHDPKKPRHRIVLALGVVAAIGIGAFGIGNFPGRTHGIDWSTPVPTDEKQDWIEAQLRRGEEVDLVPLNKNPRWYQVKSPAPLPRNAGNGRPFELSGRDRSPTLLELCRDPQVDNYRFDATLLQTETARSPGCRVGIYAGYHSEPNTFGNRTNLHWGLTFNDLIARSDGGIVVSYVAAAPNEPDISQTRVLMLDPAKKRFAPSGDPQRKVRRQLAIVLRGGIAEVYFENGRVGTFALTDLDAEMQKATREAGLANAPQAFHRRGGLGVVAQSASVEILECRLTPLHMEN